MPSTHPTITALPRSHPDPSKFHRLTTRYKAFRLLSLRLSPESFGSTHAGEAAFPWATWTSRLANPSATTVIAYETPSPHPDSAPGPAPDGPPPPPGLVPVPPANADADADADTALDAEWLAHLCVLGPLDPPALATVLHLDPPALAGFGPPRAAHYALTGMYVVPAARGRGLAARTLEHAKDLVAAEAGSRGRTARVSLVVDYDNVAARRTYERSGFGIARRYWFDDHREGRGPRTEAAVMVIDLAGEGAQHVENDS